MSRYLPKNTKTGNFNTQRTLSGSFFVIPERLASIRAIVLVFTANKQTNTLNYIHNILFISVVCTSDYKTSYYTCIIHTVCTCTRQSLIHIYSTYIIHVHVPTYIQYDLLYTLSLMHIAYEYILYGMV